MARCPVGFYFRGRVASRTSPVPVEQVRLVLRTVKSRRLDLVSCSGWEPEPELPVAPVAGIEKFQGSGAWHNYGPPRRVCTWPHHAFVAICPTLSAPC